MLHTYEDILIARFQINDSLWGPDAMAKVKMSAAKLSPTCQKLSPNSSSDFDHLSVWNCNYTWVDVETDLSVLWSEDGVTIDHNNPPTWDESTARPWDPPFSVPMIDELIVSDTSNYTTLDDLGIAGLPSIFVEPTGASRLGDIGVETNFGYILEPYGRITKEDLGSRDMEEDVLRSLHSGVTFAVAQLANREQRLGRDESSLSSPSTMPKDSSRDPISVDVTDHTKQRVVQNSTVTFILIAILSVVAVVHIWAVISESWRRYAKPSTRNLWLLDLELRGVAPPDLNSFNMMKALLEGSNCGKILPANAHLMSAEELHRHLQGHEFRLGWFYNTKTKKELYTIGALNEGDLVVQQNSP